MYEKLKGKKILVTGGCGFIGSHIVDKLVNIGVEVIVLDNLVTGSLENIKHLSDSIQFIQKDLRDSEALDQALKGVDMINHQAALRSVPKSVEEPFSYHDVNVTGTLNLFLKARDLGIKRIVFASSSSVYGEDTHAPFKESSLLPQPLSPYAKTKQEGEKLCASFSHLIPTLICLRFFTVYGPRGRPDMAPYLFLSKLLTGEEIVQYGDGSTTRDYTYVLDIVQGIIAALSCSPRYAIYNLGSARPVSLSQFITTLEKVTHTTSKITPVSKPLEDVPHTFADITLAQKELDYTVSVSLEEGLTAFYQWYLAHRETTQSSQT